MRKYLTNIENLSLTNSDISAYLITLIVVVVGQLILPVSICLGNVFGKNVSSLAKSRSNNNTQTLNQYLSYHISLKLKEIDNPLRCL